METRDGAPLVASNFGILTERDGGWVLTCEERVGGLILDVKSNGQDVVSSTDIGLFDQGADACQWTAGPTSARANWVLSHALGAPTGDDTESSQLALISDPDTQLINLEQSTGGDFAVLHTFESLASYRQVEASPDFKYIFVAGYAQNPRAWYIAFSQDYGETWNEVAPPDVDNDYATLSLRLVDPESPSSVLVIAQTVAGQPNELWRFDSTTGEASRVLTLEDEELLTGLTVKGDAVWVSGERRGAGSLYRAPRSSLEFSRVIDDGPPFSCLGTVNDALYACVDDYTYTSAFILGMSMDDGASWIPRLTLDDLGRIDSCGADCAVTTDWLHATYGNSEPDTTSSGADAGAMPSGSSKSGGKSGSCQVSAGRPTATLPVSGLVGFLTLLLAGLLRRRSAA